MYILLLVNSLCTAVFIGIGIYAMRRENPMWFYSGTSEQLEKESFHDVEEYNKKNGWMWICYGVCIFLVPIPAYWFHFSSNLFLCIYLIVMIGGFLVMALYWNHLHKKYTIDPAA